jgi:DNA polymerase III epsilon subunit-like protein
VNALFSRYHRLVKLPDLEHVEWANAVLHFPNLAFCVIDSTGIRAESDIIRVLLTDVQGNPLFDRIIRPQRQPGQANTFYTGITHEQISNAPVLAEIWDELRAALVGKYLLAYNWKFLGERLRENALCHDLPPLYLVGECLMNRAASYYRTSTALKLADLCGRLGQTLPQPATALERATGQRAFLHAMAQGITTVHFPQALSHNLEDDDLDDLDEEHPF